MKLYIEIKNVNDAVEFVNTISEYECDMDLISGCNYIDAKSLLGVIGVGTGKKVRLDIHGEGERIRERIKKYIA